MGQEIVVPSSRALRDFLWGSACKAGLRPCSPSSPNSATAPVGRCALAEFLRFEVLHAPRRTL